MQVTKHTTFLNITGALMMRKGDEAGLHMLENSGQNSIFGEEQVKAYCDGIQDIVDEVRLRRTARLRSPACFVVLVFSLRAQTVRGEYVHVLLDSPAIVQLLTLRARPVSCR